MELSPCTGSSPRTKPLPDAHWRRGVGSYRSVAAREVFQSHPLRPFTAPSSAQGTAQPHPRPSWLSRVPREGSQVMKAKRQRLARGMLPLLPGTFEEPEALPAQAGAGDSPAAGAAFKAEAAPGRSRSRAGQRREPPPARSALFFAAQIRRNVIFVLASLSQGSGAEGRVERAPRPPGPCPCLCREHAPRVSLGCLPAAPVFFALPKDGRADGTVPWVRLSSGRSCWWRGETWNPAEPALSSVCSHPLRCRGRRGAVVHFGGFCV